MKSKKNCPVKYFGPSYPKKHGTKCEMHYSPHPGHRHIATDSDGNMLSWWTAEEKVKRESRN